MAAGIIALALEANRNLTWRDVQHLIVETAKPKYLNALDWKTNGVGKRVSHAFGFGMMDAAQFVIRVNREDWSTIVSTRLIRSFRPNSGEQCPRNEFAIRMIRISLHGQSLCDSARNERRASRFPCRTFKKYERVVIQMHTDACVNSENEINFLEHVQSKVSVRVKYRGK